MSYNSRTGTILLYMSVHSSKSKSVEVDQTYHPFQGVTPGTTCESHYLRVQWFLVKSYVSHGDIE